MKTVLIAGGTGLVGTRLTELLLEREYNVVTLSRNSSLRQNPIFQKLKHAHHDLLDCAYWNPDNFEYDPSVFSRAHAIINLSGANIGEKRWTEQRKRQIQNSRIYASQTIRKALSETSHKVDTIINSSAIGWYGDDKDRPEETPFSEDITPANDFIGITCRLWEESITPVVQETGARLVILRTGLVLSKHGGIIPYLMKSLNVRVGTVFGHGHQVFSWIHIDDLCDLYIASLENEDMNGVYNAVSPFSVTNNRLVVTLAEKLYGKSFAIVHIPKPALKLTLGEMSGELLKSCLVSSKKVLDAGFTFQYPRIKDAVEELLR